MWTSGYDVVVWRMERKIKLAVGGPDDLSVLMELFTDAAVAARRRMNHAQRAVYHYAKIGHRC